MSKPEKLQNPHDKLFKVTFSAKREAKAFLKKFSEKWLVNGIDFRTFRQTPVSYVNDDLKESFSDIVYEAKWKDSKKKVRVSFLFEHKSYQSDDLPLQLGEYLINGYKIQRKNEEDWFVIIPIVIYHDKREWKKLHFKDYFDLPDARLAKYIIDFDYDFIDLTRLADEYILNIREAQVLSSTFLLFKYKGDKKELERIIGEIFIFVREREVEEYNKRHYIRALLKYIFNTFGVKPKELQEMIKTLPPMVIQESKTTADYIHEEGMAMGMEKGIEKGMEKGKKLTEAILTFKNLAKMIVRFPDFSDEQIAAYHEVQTEKVTELRKIKKQGNQKTDWTKIKKLFFAGIKMNDEEMSQIREEYVKIVS